MSKVLSKLGAAFDRGDWQWLLDNHEDIADMLREEVREGAAPDEIRRFILSQVSPERTGMAARCENAARYLHSLKASA